MAAEARLAVVALAVDLGVVVAAEDVDEGIAEERICAVVLVRRSVGFADVAGDGQDVVAGVVDLAAVRTEEGTEVAWAVLFAALTACLLPPVGCILEGLAYMHSSAVVEAEAARLASVLGAVVALDACLAA